MSKLSGIFTIFNYRNYRLFFFGQGISFIGSMMQNTAQGWLIYRLTNSASMLGIVAFAGQIPAFFMAPIAGILSDRVERKKIILAADLVQMIQALILAILVISGMVKPWHIVLLAGMLGIANGFEITTRHSIVPDIVTDKKDLGKAIAMNSAMFNIGRMVGPSIAGLLVACWGEGACFAINALTYSAIFYALLAMRLPKKKYPEKKTHPLDDLREGYKYSFTFKPLRDIIFLMGFISLTGASIIVLMPMLVKDVLHGGPQTLGFLMGSIGVGALIGAYYLASRKRIPGLGKVIAMAVLIFGTAICFLAFTSSTPVSILLLVMAGIGIMLHMSASNTLIQTIAEDRLRGRVISFYIMAFSGFGPIGNLLSGYAAKTFGIKTTILAAGLLTLSGAFVFSLILPKMKVLLKPVYVRKGILPADTGVE